MRRTGIYRNVQDMERRYPVLHAYKVSAGLRGEVAEFVRENLRRGDWTTQYSRAEYSDITLDWIVPLIVKFADPDDALHFKMRFT